MTHASKIDEYCRDFDRERFLSDPLVQDAVGMNFIAIGQRMMDIRHDDPVIFAEFTDGIRIIGLRHRLAHEYQKIDFGRIWAYVDMHLSRLHSEAVVLRDRFVDEYKIKLD